MYASKLFPTCFITFFAPDIAQSVSDSVSGSFCTGPTGRGENSEGLIVNLLARSVDNFIGFHLWVFSSLLSFGSNSIGLLIDLWLLLSCWSNWVLAGSSSSVPCLCFKTLIFLVWAFFLLLVASRDLFPLWNTFRVYCYIIIKAQH